MTKEVKVTDEEETEVEDLEELTEVTLEDELELLREELKQEKDKNLRTKAELQNYKKRKEDEISRFYKYEGESIFKNIISVIDNFERAIKLDDNDLTDELSLFLDGFKLIYGELINTLNNYEVKEIKAEGLEFDPNFHQAVITEKDENKPKGVVLEVLQKGYIYKDRVIRPAMVKVNE